MPSRGSKWLLHNFIINFVHIFIFKSEYENIAVLLMKIQVFWDVVTAGKRLSDDMVFHSKRPESTLKSPNLVSPICNSKQINKETNK